MNNNFNNIEEKSVNTETVNINRSGKKHAGVVIRRAATGIMIVSLLSGAIYLANKNKVPTSFGYPQHNISDIDSSNSSKTDNETSYSDTEKELTKEEKLNNLFNEMYKYASENEIKDLVAYYEEHYFDLNYDVNTDGPDEELMYLYASNAYKRAHDKGLDNKVIMNELEEMYKLQEVPRCMFEEDLNKISNLNNTIDQNRESAFMVYGPLSFVAHNEVCEKEHVMNAAGGISHKGEEPDFGTQYTLKY